MKLLLQAWNDNSLYDWGIACGILLIVMLGLALLRYGAGRILSAVARRTATQLDDIVVQVIAATRLWLLFPLALYAGASVVDLPQKLDHLISIIVVVFLMLQAALWINRFVSAWLERKIQQRRGMDGAGVTALELLGLVARVVVWLLILLLILDHLNFDITTLVASLGIGGVAVALAIQNILGDLFASLSIVLDKPFVIGDFIIVGDYLGTVEHIGLKTTRLRSLSGELIVFSNADLLKSRVRNYKRMYERRVLFTLGVVYQTPPEKLERIPAILREVITAQNKTRFDRAHFKEYGDSALIFEAVYYVLDPDYNVYMDIHQAINLEICRKFAGAGIDFAYPTRTLYINNAVPVAT